MGRRSDLPIRILSRLRVIDSPARSRLLPTPLLQVERPLMELQSLRKRNVSFDLRDFDDQEGLSMDAMSGLSAFVGGEEKNFGASSSGGGDHSFAKSKFHLPRSEVGDHDNQAAN